MTDAPRPVLVVPPHLAEWLNLFIAQAMTGMERANGATPDVPGLATFRSDLRRLAMSARGRPVVIVEPVEVAGWLTVDEAAAAMRVTPRHARRLAHDGQVIARRKGRDWEIYRPAAEDYGRRRRAA